MKPPQGIYLEVVFFSTEWKESFWMDQQRAFTSWGLSILGLQIMPMLSSDYQLPNLLCLFCRQMPIIAHDLLVTNPCAPSAARLGNLGNDQSKERVLWRDGIGAGITQGHQSTEFLREHQSVEKLNEAHQAPEGSDRLERGGGSSTCREMKTGLIIPCIVWCMAGHLWRRSKDACRRRIQKKIHAS